MVKSEDPPSHNHGSVKRWVKISNTTVDGSEIPNNHRLDGAKTL